MASAVHSPVRSRQQASGLDILAHGAAYANSDPYPTPAAHRPLDPAGPASTHDSAPVLHRKRSPSGRPKCSSDEDCSSKPTERVRRRITRACDRCNALRTKCNGAEPCLTCTENAAPCEYKRATKKRGKLSAKERRRAEAEQQITAASASPRSAHVVVPAPAASASQATPVMANELTARSPSQQQQQQQLSQQSLRRSDLPVNTELGRRLSNGAAPPTPGFGNTENFTYGDFRDINGYFPPSQAAPYDHFGNDMQPVHIHTGLTPNGQRTYSLPTPQRRSQAGSGEGLPTLASGSSAGDGSLHGWLGGLNGAQSPSRFSLPSIPSPGNVVLGSWPSMDKWTRADLKYPVLRPILGYISGIIPVSLACELLELYFESSTSAFQHPTSPYVIGYVFRKNSFLDQHNPRRCSPALLASMLWIAAQTSNASFLTASIAARGKACQRLLELTLNLLKPLVHQSNSGDDPSVTVINGVALGGFGVNVNLPLPGGRHASDIGQYHPQAAGGEVDDVVTYMHLATVISASEYKASSMRWWSVVYSLVREFRFAKELPRSTDEAEVEKPIDLSSGAQRFTEEAREERRRVWWLAYTVDKHLALCYNIPLCLRDSECNGLIRPVPEEHWQAGEAYIGPPAPDEVRPHGVWVEMTDHGIFGFFTPLMILLGECIDLQQARLRSRSPLFQMMQGIDPMVQLIKTHLDIYQESILTFRSAHLPNSMSEGAGPPIPPSGPLTELQVQTVIATAYASYVIRVLKILLNGRWDPIMLLDDEDLWISSSDFIIATGHAVDGAEALSPILEFDPDLSYMPWFFGIYLLQGSFLLLLFADRLGAEVGERYVHACERSVRAIEACVVTLNTEYQRNFRKVMRSALGQVRGRVVVDSIEQQTRRRELLGLYRWTPDGSGLAL